MFDEFTVDDAGDAEQLCVAVATSGHEILADAGSPKLRRPPAVTTSRQQDDMTIASTITTAPATMSDEPGEAPPFERFLADAGATPVGIADGGVIGAALEQALAGRTTRVTICGAAGTGHARVIEARAEAAGRGMRVLATHGRAADADVPYGSLMTLLHPVADRIGELPTSERESLPRRLSCASRTSTSTPPARTVAAAHPD